MKIPQTFLPEKNLDEKVEELKNYKEEQLSDVEKFLKKYNITYEESRKIFYKIIEDTFSDRINWEPGPKKNKDRLESYIAETIITNAKGKEVPIPILFYTVKFSSTLNSTIFGFLHLGNEKGLCLNTADPEVKRLARDYFKINLYDP